MPSLDGAAVAYSLDGSGCFQGSTALLRVSYHTEAEPLQEVAKSLLRIELRQAIDAFWSVQLTLVERSLSESVCSVEPAPQLRAALAQDAHKIQANPAAAAG